jgi:2-dehydro-3-deoxygluconokinase
VALEAVTLGETMVLLLAEQAGPMREATTFRRHIAGAETNVAVGLTRLGHSVGWISRVGDDEFGRAIVFRLRGEGVDTSHVIHDPRAHTGILVRERREHGPIDQVYYRRESAASRLSPEDLDPAYIGQATFFHLTGITPALSASCRETVFAAAEIARAAGVSVVLDPNFRSRLWPADTFRRVVRDLCTRCDIVLPGLEEAELLTGRTDPEAAARDLRALGPSTVVVKLGAGGALSVSDDATERVPAIPLERIIDPVGAGDAFAAGYLTGLLRGLTSVEALRLANRCGALAMCAPGDMESLPRWEELNTDDVGDIRR